MNRKSLLKLTNEFRFPARSKPMFEELGITHIWQLCLCKPKDIRRFKGIGEVTFEQIENILKKAGVSMGAKFTQQRIKELQSISGVEPIVMPYRRNRW